MGLSVRPSITILPASGIFASVTESISGAIKDSGGAVAPGVTVLYDGGEKRGSFDYLVDELRSWAQAAQSGRLRGSNSAVSEILVACPSPP